MESQTDILLKQAAQSGKPQLEDLTCPLVELTEDSSTLVVGYGLGQAGVRDEMIPYFHILGPDANEDPVRLLIVGGWLGSDTAIPLAVARFIAAIESCQDLIQGLEITAYPVSNVEAYREGVFLTGKQQIEGVKCWSGSTCSHVKVIENEMTRYNYDAVILLAESTRGGGLAVDAWDGGGTHLAPLKTIFESLSGESPELHWGIDPATPAFARTFTPIPENLHQPKEILISFPPHASAVQGSDVALDLLLKITAALQRSSRASVS
ncbi:MAG: hypothetical protein WEB60_08560 [Terrimicrobiaceae bacterium]